MPGAEATVAGESAGPLVVTRAPRVHRWRIHRPERGNSIDAGLLAALHRALDVAEQDPDCRTVVLEGAPGVFCTGMDFQAAMADADRGTDDAAGIAEYLRLLGRFASSPRIVVSLVDGKVIAGGVGLVAASDYAIGTARAEFSLSEALWGLLPCCVLPYLMRRIGFQKAYVMTLGTRWVTSAAAAEMHLLDEVVEDAEGGLRRWSMRCQLLHPQTVVDLKRYFRALAPVTPEVEQLALTEIARLSNQPRVRQNIANFIQHGRYPWEEGPRPA